MGKTEGRINVEANSTRAATAGKNDPSMHLTLAEAAWLLDSLDLAAGKVSPLRQAAGTPFAERERAALARKGLLDDAGNVPQPIASFLETVANPGCEMIIDVGNATFMNFMRVYFGSAGRPAGCTPLDGSTFKLAPELQFEDILVTLLEGLRLHAAVSRFPVSFALSAEGLLALAALIDALRQQQLRSLLNRNQNAAGDADFIDVWACLQRGILEDDFRWLVPVVRSRLPGGLTMKQSTLSEGLAEIAAAGIARREGDSWTLAETHLDPLAELMTPLNFGSVFARAAAGGEEIRLFLIKCPKALFAVNFSGGDKASLFTLSAEQLGTIVAEIVARLTVTGRQIARVAALDRGGTGRRPAAAATATPGPEKAKAVPVDRDKTMVLEKNAVCPACGRLAKPGDRFCGGCGQVL